MCFLYQKPLHIPDAEKNNVRTLKIKKPMLTDKTTNHCYSINICTATEEKNVNGKYFKYTYFSPTLQRRESEQKQETVVSYEPSVLKVNFKQNRAKFNQKLVYNIVSGNE